MVFNGEGEAVLTYHKKPIGLVICDVDDTLVDSFEVFLASVATAATSRGLSMVPMHEYFERFRHGNQEGVQPVHNLFKYVWPHALSHDDAVHMGHHYREVAGKHTAYTQTPFAREFLMMVRGRGIPVAICSNEREDIARQRLTCVDIHHAVHYTAIKCATTSIAKPHAGMALELCTELGVAPEETLFIGDLITDQLTAKNAGTEYAMITTGTMNDTALIKNGCTQDRIFKNLQELAEFLV